MCTQGGKGKKIMPTKESNMRQNLKFPVFKDPLPISSSRDNSPHMISYNLIYMN